jgi:hypothetical protein
MMRALALLLLLLLAACGARGTWEPVNANVARYGSWTDEALLLSSTLAAVEEVVDLHPESRSAAVSIRVPHDPESYMAAALLADALETRGAAVAWISEDATPKTGEVWEVASAIRGAVTLPSHVDPPFRREALVAVRVAALDPGGRLLWTAQGAGKAESLVNVYFADRKVLPRVFIAEGRLIPGER